MKGKIKIIGMLVSLYAQKAVKMLQIHLKRDEVEELLETKELIQDMIEQLKDEVLGREE